LAVPNQTSSFAGGYWLSENSRVNSLFVSDITSLAERPNIVCKLSGLVTEAAPDRQIADLCKAVDQVLCFGPQRLL
jgi:predicted TIM-barrel fold metal-dependent hydrolase